MSLPPFSYPIPRSQRHPCPHSYSYPNHWLRPSGNLTDFVCTYWSFILGYEYGEVIKIGERAVVKEHTHYMMRAEVKGGTNWTELETIWLIPKKSLCIPQKIGGSALRTPLTLVGNFCIIWWIMLGPSFWRKSRVSRSTAWRCWNVGLRVSP